MLGVFCALDLVLFYLFFEAGLIPMFLIIGIWGGKQPHLCRVQVLPLHLPRLGADAGGDDRDVCTTPAPPTSRRCCTTSSPAAPIGLLGFQIAGGMQTLLWLAFFASFAVKMPMWPVHTWLPDAHVQAPTAGSVVLAAILLKMGGYGFLRFSLPMFPVASDELATVRLLAVGHRHRLHLAGGAGAGGHEEADRLFLGRPHGLCHDGHLRGQPAGRGRRDLPDAQPRLRLGRAVPLRRRDLRPDAHPRDRRLWRAGQPDAGLCAGLHAVHHGQRRPAGHQRASSASS